MQRIVHQLFGLIFLPLVVILGISGAVLAVYPVLEAANVNLQAAGDVNVASLAQAVQTHLPNVERMERKASGDIIAHVYQDGTPTAFHVDPLTGETLSPVEPSTTRIWIQSLHRSFFLGNGGRMMAGLGAATMALLCLSGGSMLARRAGGWRQLAAPIKGSHSQRLHLEIARVTLLGLVLSSLTGVYLSMANFDVVSSGDKASAEFPMVNGGTPLTVSGLSALQAIDTTQLRDLSFPYPGDNQDAYSIITDLGSGYVDQATGQMLSFTPHGFGASLFETIYMLHTGEGMAWLGAILGVSALGIPLMGVSGTLIWVRRRNAYPRITNNAQARQADTIILVGTEGNSTWAFSRALHNALHSAGQTVHTAPMNSVCDAHLKAKQMFILTATYGDGEAPQSAKHFLSRLQKLDPENQIPVSVLGFGDRQFSKFCQYAFDVERTLHQAGWPHLAPIATINRQSPHEFSLWGEAISAHLRINLVLDYQPHQPNLFELKLISRVDYGQLVQAPTTIFRFALPEHNKSALSFLGGASMPDYDVGDLLCIVPPGSPVPRYYSLASAHQNGFVEICVRHVPGGLCSGYLHSLQPGDPILAFLRANPDFRPANTNAPVILIGAGAGIGPLAGFVRNNTRKRQMHLYFGGRHPSSDFLYQEDMDKWQEAGHLSSLIPVFSRNKPRRYVQDGLRQDAERIKELVRNGAQIMVCGGRDMAQGVEAALANILKSTDIETAQLKLEGRYVEDIY